MKVLQRKSNNKKRRERERWKWSCGDPQFGNIQPQIWERSLFKHCLQIYIYIYIYIIFILSNIERYIANKEEKLIYFKSLKWPNTLRLRFEFELALPGELNMEGFDSFTPFYG